MILIFRITTASQSRSSCKNLCRAQNNDDSVSFTENLLNIFETKLHKKNPLFRRSYIYISQIPENQLFEQHRLRKFTTLN